MCMKTVRIMIWSAMLMVAGIWVSCTDYQDEIDALDYRVTVLENLVSKYNHDLEAMQVIVQAMENGDFITNVSESSDGYIITFKKSGAIVVHNGIDGTNGKNGKDAQTPTIEVEQGADGYYYWVVNGVVLTTPDGQAVRANGRDGKDGLDGKDGKAVAPQLRINDVTGIWEISVDGGQTWTSTGTAATGKNGKDGRDGKDGEDGQDGKDGQDANSIIQSVTVFKQNNVTYVRFVHTGGYFDIPLLNV